MRVAWVCLAIVIFGLILTGQSDAKIDNATIVAMWLFDEGGGKNVKDSSGNKTMARLRVIPHGATASSVKLWSSMAKIPSLIVDREPALILWVKRISLYPPG